MGWRSLHLRSAPGLSRARNVALAAATATLVGFPDDDCAYPADLLARVAAAFAADPGLDLLTGRTAEPSGRRRSAGRTEARTIVASDVWHAGNSASTFLRRALLERVGPFDERLGLGSGTPWTSGEDIDLLVRALAVGAVARQDPSLVVHHRHREPTGDELVALGRRDGGSVGFLLGRHALGGTGAGADAGAAAAAGSSPPSHAATSTGPASTQRRGGGACGATERGARRRADAP